MTIPILDQLSNLWKPRRRHLPEHRHLMLAGIHQNVFLNHWGPPQIRINLDHLEGSYHGDSLALAPHSSNEVVHSVWIYPKEDRIFFFTHRKLASHFKWSTFRERRDRILPKPVLLSDRFNKRPTAMTQALSIVA